MIDKNFLSKDGLINSKPNIESSEENSPLWSLTYRVMFSANVESVVIHGNLIKFIRKCETDIKGLYNQRYGNNGSHEDYMSRDQLIAFVGALHLAGQHKKVKEIAKYLRTHWFTYDNVGKTTNYKRVFPPWSKAVLFTFYCACAASYVVQNKGAKFNREKTSGTLKAATILFALKKWRALDYLERVACVDDARAAYYIDGHPINPGFCL